jgi:hypothetical protein
MSGRRIAHTAQWRSKEVDMSMTPRLISCALALALCYPAHAQNVEIGTSLLCDNRDEIERVITLYDGDMQAAIEQVNAEQHDPTACALSVVAYIRAPQVETTRKGNTSFQIVPILILGVMTHGEIRSVSPTRYFSLFEVEERAA